MGQVKVLRGIGFALCFVLLSASAVSAQTPAANAARQAQQAPQSIVYEFCVSGTTYYSGVFGGTYAALRPAGAAFVKFLEQQYSFKSTGDITSDVACYSVVTEAQARANEQAMMGTNVPNNKIVETGWTYSGAGSASTTTSASLAGAWTITVDSRVRGPLIIKQDGNKIAGTINLNDEAKPLPVEGTVNGDNLHFTAKRSDGVVEDYTGTLQRSGEWMGLRNDSDNRITGSKWTGWRAVTSYGSCLTYDDPHTAYFSAVFDAGPVNHPDPAWPVAFASFLKQKYGPQQYSVTCDLQNSSAAEQAFKQKNIDAVRATHVAQNIVDTGWTYSGAGAAATSPSNPAPTNTSPSAAVPASSGQSSSPSTPAPATATQVAPTPGTTVEVRMIETVDSSRDPAGQQYRATVTQTVNAGSVTIQQGAVATVTLARNGANWVAQLSSIMINGQAVAVASRSATVITGGITTAQNTAGTVSNTVGGIFGRKPNVPSAVPPVATGDRVILPPGSRLSFVLTATQ